MDSHVLLFPPDQDFFVRLLPGETMQQYEDKFQVWLNERVVAMKLLKDKPEVERLFRRDFATLRAWELHQQKITMESHCAASTLDGSAESEEEGEVREDKATDSSVPCLRRASRAQLVEKKEAVAEKPQYQGLRSRDELLKMQEMPVDEFVKIFDRYGPNGYTAPNTGVLPIAIVMRPDESVEKYERVFQKWLQHKDMTLEMLKDDPEEERRYRQCYAYTRVHHQKWNDGFRDASKNRQLLRSRSPSQNKFRSGQSWSTKRPSIEFKRRRSRKEDCNESNSHWSRRNEKQPQVYSDYDARRRSSTVSRSGTNREIFMQRYDFQGANHFATDVKEEEKQPHRWAVGRGSDVMNIPRGSKTTMSNCSTGSRTSFSYAFKAPEASPCEEEGSLWASQASDSAHFSEISLTVASCAENQSSVVTQEVQTEEQDQSCGDSDNMHPSAASPQGTNITPSILIRASTTTQLQDCAEIIQAAVEILSETDQVDANPTIQHLIDDYIRFTDQIVVNETAVSDLMIHVNAVENIDKIELREEMGLIAEATDLISEVKARRNATLVDIVTQQWTQSHEELERVLLLPAEYGVLSASHEHLASVYSKLKQKDEEIMSYKVTLECRLSLLQDGVTCQEDSDMEVLHVNICNLSAESTAKMLLEDQSRRLALNLLRSTGEWQTQNPQAGCFSLPSS